MFKYIILFTAFLLAACAAWFSVTGIAQLFIGATTAATIMAASLELGKIVGVSYLYRYWTDINRAIKTYMLAGSLVLMGITSVGIYGFLTAAYASAAVDFTTKQSEVALLDTEKQGVQTQIASVESRVERLEQTRHRQEARLDSLVGRNGFITQQRVVQQTESAITAAQNDLSKLYRQRDSLNLIQVKQTGELTSGSKIGTFYYVAQSLGVPLDSVVKWFTLIIVFVFDPMSIALIIAYNSLAVKTINSTKKDDDPILEKKIAIEDVSNTTEEVSEPILEAIPEPIVESPAPLKTDDDLPDEEKWWATGNAVHTKRSGIRIT